MNKESLLYAYVAQATYINKSSHKSFVITAKFENKGTDTQGLFGEAHGNTYVVAFRGSEETGIADWITDLKFIPMVYPYGKPNDKSMTVHSGFMGAYNSVREAVQKAVKSTKHKQVVFVGHSLGGALASLAALDTAYNIPGKEISCYTYGSPKVGNDNFVKAYNKLVPNTYRCVNGRDMVPSAPPGAFGHVGQLYCVGGATAQEYGWTELVANLMDKIDDHFPNNYINELKVFIKTLS
ncbi:MAG: lipase family protein [Anaerolineae bacterium]|nr:lipase family protein [Anaerolineae bacterium]